ncbi:2-oxo-4-hydroxy-4-carboxy-5-ureidoimidazoline decarboxylase [Allobranchiibius sp. CTAmp26]|nr:2-oxo-4-hydroxy-4-carboxy-5-ureidoimidazoline decarboxylase [Allobranchiibius sp. CTAmp26]
MPVTDPAEPAEPLPVGRFDELPATGAADLLRACCAAPGWIARMVQGRPYAERDRLLAASDTAFGTFVQQDVDDALADHPRIGDRVGGGSGAAAFSRAEQAAVGDAHDQVRRDLAAGNRAYEERFDRVFLIRAAGRSPEQILAELHRRMGNDDAAEVAEVVEQLRQITRLRLQASIR